MRYSFAISSTVFTVQGTTLICRTWLFLCTVLRFTVFQGSLRLQSLQERVVLGVRFFTKFFAAAWISVKSMVPPD